MPDTSTPSSTHRKPGAQPGNSNALRHGFYAKSFTKAELLGLETDIQGEFTDEIELARTNAGRLAELLMDYKNMDIDDVGRRLQRPQQLPRPHPEPQPRPALHVPQPDHPRTGPRRTRQNPPGGRLNTFLLILPSPNVFFIWRSRSNLSPKELPGRGAAEGKLGVRLATLGRSIRSSRRSEERISDEERGTNMFRGPNTKSPILNPQSPIPNTDFRITNFEFRISNYDYRIPALFFLLSSLYPLPKCSIIPL